MIDLAALKLELKELIIKESGKEYDPRDIQDNEPLFGGESILNLDSLDALQISVAIHHKYNKKLNDSKEAMRALANINTLANFISEENN
ncbi:MAG: phosphopantetheine-binding protein [Campylobacteraceae bacterium]|jgi:acyl carrier protein|nr:phosphopantetheine-binding protein [Campylobacteraceae bacterium]